MRFDSHRSGVGYLSRTVAKYIELRKGSVQIPPFCRLGHQPVAIGHSTESHRIAAITAQLAPKATRAWSRLDVRYLSYEDESTVTAGANHLDGSVESIDVPPLSARLMSELAAAHGKQSGAVHGIELRLLPDGSFELYRISQGHPSTACA